ncbi:PucR family transcriptional regulator [Nocardia sp. IBHARD005]|uniref:PucR family transcriptional regulator n=1 Tax=Nocardia sp. IBHARD005 TaxID=3457765 RepID=UPI00405A1F7A
MDDRELIRALRGQMSNLSAAFALSMVMFDRLDEREILELAVSSVKALGRCRAEGAYLTRDQTQRAVHGDDVLLDRLATLGGADGPVTLSTAPWAWAYPLRSVGGHAGYLVVSAPAEPSADQRFLLRTLAQQTGAALQSAWLYRSEQEAATTLRDLNERLTTLVADLEHRSRIHEVLTAVAAAGAGEAGIAEALFELTQLPVAVEDRFGYLRAWGGPGRPGDYPLPSARRRVELLADVRRSGRALRQGDRFVAVAQPRGDVLGVLALIDPDQRAGQHDVFALEHGAVVLAMELAHQRGVAETELRLCRDLVDDLIGGTDDESALLRASALGHDLQRPHQVLVVKWRGLAGDETLARAVRQAATRILEAGPLLARRAGEVVLVAPRPEGVGDSHRWNELHRRVAKAVHSTDGAVGVGRLCAAPSELPRSYAEAVQALTIRQGSGSPSGVTTFDELGIYRLLGAADGDQVAEFVREWLGPLIDYDASHKAELVTTLWQYFECGGNYDATAGALRIHRSTLRYRLRRIRELTGHDLGAVDSRLNLHVATRAWQILQSTSRTRHP